MVKHKRSSIPGFARGIVPLAGLVLSLASTLPASAQPAPPPPPAPPPASSSASPSATTTPPAPAPSLLPPAPPPPLASPPPAADEPADRPAKPKRKKQPAAEGAPNPGMMQPPPPMWSPADDATLPVLPRRIDYEEGDILLPGYELKVKPNRGLVVGGIVAFAVPYGLSALVGGASALDGENNSETLGPLLVPIFGPFITLGVTNARTNEFPSQRSSDDDLFSFFMLLNGFTQLTGAAMFAAGILVPEKYLERAQALPGKPELFVGGSSAAVRFHF